MEKGDIRMLMEMFIVGNGRMEESMDREHIYSARLKWEYFFFLLFLCWKIKKISWKEFGMKISCKMDSGFTRMGISMKENSNIIGLLEKVTFFFILKVFIIF